MQILSWNVNGIRAGQRKGFLEWLDKQSPDIIGIQETKAHVEQLDEELINLKGYYSFWHSGERKGYSGVAIYTKKEPNKVVTDFGVDILNHEGRIIQAEYDNFTLLNIYFPNGKRDQERLDYKMNFYTEFLKYINSLREKGHKIIFCGDVNTAHTEIDLARPKANEKISGFLKIEREWIDDVINDGYIDTLREFNAKPELYTWWDMKSRARDRNIGWRIDYFFIQKELRSQLKDAYIMPDVYGSDHCPVGIDIEF